MYKKGTRVYIKSIEPFNQYEKSVMGNCLHKCGVIKKVVAEEPYPNFLGIKIDNVICGTYDGLFWVKKEDVENIVRPEIHKSRKVQKQR